LFTEYINNIKYNTSIVIDPFIISILWNTNKYIEPTIQIRPVFASKLDRDAFTCCRTLNILSTASRYLYTYDRISSYFYRVTSVQCQYLTKALTFETTTCGIRLCRRILFSIAYLYRSYPFMTLCR
jgi:hypothetical protein